MAVFEGLKGRITIDGPTRATASGTRTIPVKKIHRNQLSGETSGLVRNRHFGQRIWHQKYIAALRTIAGRMSKSAASFPNRRLRMGQSRLRMLFQEIVGPYLLTSADRNFASDREISGLPFAELSASTKAHAPRKPKIAKSRTIDARCGDDFWSGAIAGSTT